MALSKDTLESLGQVRTPTPGQYEALRTALAEFGADDLEPYFFGTPHTESEKDRLRGRGGLRPERRPEATP